MLIIKRVSVTSEGVEVEIRHPHTKYGRSWSAPARRLARILCGIAGSGSVEFPTNSSFLFRNQQENPLLNSKEAVEHAFETASEWPVITLLRWEIHLPHGPYLSSVEDRGRGQPTVIIEAALSTSQAFTLWEVERIRRSMEGRQFVASNDGKLLLAQF